MHFGVLLGHLTPLAPGPHHERVHGSLDFIHGVALRVRAFGARQRAATVIHAPGHHRGHSVRGLRRGLAARLHLVFHHAVHVGPDAQFGVKDVARTVP